MGTGKGTKLGTEVQVRV